METWSFWIIVYLSALASVGWAFRDVQKRLWWKILFLPALLLDGAARALTAKLSGQKVVRFGALRDGQPFVEVGPSPRPWLGPVVGLLAGQAIFLWIFFSICPLSDAAAGLDLSLPKERVSLDRVPKKLDGILHLLDALADGVRSIPLGSPWTWLGLYAAFGLAAALALDRRQWTAGALIVVGATLIVSTLDWLGFTWRFLSRAWWIRRLYLPEFAGRFAILCAFVLGAAALGLLWRLVTPRRKKA